MFRGCFKRSQWKRGRAGEIWTWIGRGSDRVGSTKGYEGEELEGRVEWLLGGSSTECRDNKLSSAGINHHLQCSTPVTQLPLFNILVSPKHRNSLHNSVEICFNSVQLRKMLPNRWIYSLIRGVFSVGGRLSLMVIRKTVIERRAEIPRVTCQPWWWKQWKFTFLCRSCQWQFYEVQKTVPWS